MKQSITGAALGLTLLVALEPQGGLALTLSGPERYSTLVEKVSSDGSQVMDLGQKLSSDMEATVRFALNTAGLSGTRGLFGARTSASSLNFSAGNDGTGFFADFNNSAYATYRLGQTPLDKDVLYQVEISAAERILKRVADGEVVASNVTVCASSFATSKTSYLFDVNGSSWNAKGKFDLYSLSILSGGTLIRDFVPCVVDGKGRLFDRVTGAYPEFVLGTELAAGAIVEGTVPPSVNASDKSAAIGLKMGEFAEGEGPVDVWSLYAPCEWGAACSNTFVGTTFGETYESYSHTRLNYGLTQDMEIDLTFSIETDDRGERNHGLFGARNSASTNSIGIVFYGMNSDGVEWLHLDFNNSDYAKYRASYVVKKDVNRHKRYRALLSARRRVLMNADNMIVLAQNTNACPDTIKTQDIWLFGMRGCNGGCSQNLYHLKISQNGKVIHDYRPLVVNGVKGLYDCVSMTLVQSATATDFCAGSALPAAERLLTGLGEAGDYSARIPHRRLVPETEYWFGLLATGGTGKGYATWACDFPRTFTTTERIERGAHLILK